MRQLTVRRLAATAQSLWFRRALASAVLGTLGGMAVWMALL